MRIVTIARFLKMNGAITGSRDDGVKWLSLPRHAPVTLGAVLDGQHAGRHSLRIASTAVRTIRSSRG